MLLVFYGNILSNLLSMRCNHKLGGRSLGKCAEVMNLMTISLFSIELCIYRGQNIDRRKTYVLRHRLPLQNICLLILMY